MIRIKRIEHERTQDAPFIGALVCGISCHLNCKNCFNQHLKEDPVITRDSSDIIKEVLSNPFNKGIIFAGLEWSEQPLELLRLVYLCKLNELEIMLYTGLTEDGLFEKIPELKSIDGIYIKVGQYKDELKINNNKQFDVKLASSNQYIIKVGD